MARIRRRWAITETGFALTVASCGAFALSGGCAPSSGSAGDPIIQSDAPGGGVNGRGGTPPGGGGASGVSQAGLTGAGGIVGGGGFDPTSGGSMGDGGGPPGNGGAFGTGGLPPGVGGTCGMNTADPSPYSPCTTCSGGRCVPTNLLSGAPVNLLAPCDANDVCVPEQIVVQAENVLLRGCHSIAGSEGRCASLCIPAASNLSAYLPQDVCNSDERCAPCYSPADGTATGLCSLGCDPGPTQAPYIFPQCCGGAGRCAPKSALPPDTAKQLGRESCQNADDLCVPAQPILDPAFRFHCCMTGPTNSLSGICAPACIIDQNPQGNVLTQSNCQNQEKCVPCANPLTGAPTGACTDTQGKTTSTCVP